MAMKKNSEDLPNILAFFFIISSVNYILRFYRVCTNCNICSIVVSYAFVNHNLSCISDFESISVKHLLF